MSNLMYINDPHQSRNGLKYLFAYYCPEDKCWTVPTRRFILIENENIDNLGGQFISSMWWNKEYKMGDILEFVVMSVEINRSSTDVEKDMNKLKNPFPSYHDLPYYLKNVGYYVMDQPIMMKCLNHLKYKNSFEFTLKSISNPFQSVTLKLNQNTNNDSMFITCPSFSQDLSKCV